MKNRIKKTVKDVNEKLDDASRAVGQDINKVTGRDVNHVVNPEASNHKEALRDAREKLGMGDNQENKDAEPAGAGAELNS